jgi:inosine/xanthosine triphosphate pyrophosphatase family protein
MTSDFVALEDHAEALCVPRRRMKIPFDAWLDVEALRGTPGETTAWWHCKPSGANLND